MEKEREWVNKVRDAMGDLRNQYVVALRNLNDMHEEEIFSTLHPFNATLSSPRVRFRWIRTPECTV